MNAICATLKGEVYNLSTQNGGKEIWQMNLDSPIFSTPVLTPNETFPCLIIANVKGVIYKIELATKKIMWTLDTEMHVFAPLKILKSCVCAASREGKVHAINIDQGNVEWSITMKMPINAGICEVSDSKALILDNKANYKLIRSCNGVELFKGSLDIGETFSTPVMCSESLLLIGSRDDNLYCFSTKKASIFDN